MTVQKISIADARFERSPGQDGEIYAGNVVDQRHGGPVTIGYGRYAPHQSTDEEIVVHDVLIVIEGRITATSDGREMVAGPGEMIYMPAGSTVTLSTGEEGAITAYVTYPHWQEAGA